MYDEDEDDIDDIDDNQQNQPAAGDGSTTPPAIDHAAIAQTVAQTMQQFQQTQNQNQQREYTPEELSKHFQIWNPDERFVNELNALNDPEAPIDQKLGVLHGLRDGIMQQAFRAAQLYMEQQMGQFKQQINPAIEMAQQRQSKQLMGEFHTRYPGLKGQEELVDSITARLSATGFKPKSKDEAFDKVATIAESVLKKANPQFALKKSEGVNGMPSMAGTNMGGFSTGNSGGGSRGSSNKRGGLAKIFQG